MKIMMFIVAVALGIAMSIADTPGSKQSPPTTVATTEPVFSIRVMTCNFGPLGQLVSAQAAADAGPVPRFKWFTSQTDAERARIIKDLDTWKVVIAEPVGPDPANAFGADSSVWTLVVPAGPKTSVGSVSFSAGSRHIHPSTRTKNTAADLVSTTLTWRPGGVHEMSLGDGVQAESVVFTLAMEVERGDLRPVEPANSATSTVRVNSLDQPFRLPPEIIGPLVESDPAMDGLFRNACLMLSDDGGGNLILGFNGGVGEGHDSVYFRIDTENLGDEKVGDWHHVMGFVRITTTIAGAAAPEHDIGFDSRFRAAGRNLPDRIPITFTSPDGAEGTIATDPK